MTVPNFPLARTPQVSGYEFGPSSGVIATAVLGGAPRVGLAWGRGVRLFKLRYIFSTIELQVWTFFYVYTINNGSLSFNLEIDSGNGLINHVVTILPDSCQTAAIGGGNYSVSFNILTEESTYALGPAFGSTVTMLYGLYGEGAADLLAAITRLALIDSLALAAP